MASRENDDNTTLADEPVIGLRRSQEGPARLLMSGLAEEAEQSVEVLGVCETTPALVEAHQEYAMSGVAAHLRPGLAPGRIIDATIVSQFEEAAEAVKREKQELDATRAEVQEAVAARRRLRAPPTTLASVGLKAATVVALVLTYVAAAMVLGIGLDEAIVRPYLGGEATLLAKAVAAVLALTMTGGVLGTVAVATLGAGRMSLTTKILFVLADAVYAASYFAIRTGGGDDQNLVVHLGWSGLEAFMVAVAAVMLAAVAPDLRRAAKRRRKYANATARIEDLREAEAAVGARLRAAQVTFSRRAAVLQEREEALEEAATCKDLAAKTVGLAVIRGVAKNQQRAGGGS